MTIKSLPQSPTLLHSSGPTLKSLQPPHSPSAYATAPSLPTASISFHPPRPSPMTPPAPMSQASTAHHGSTTAIATAPRRATHLQACQHQISRSGIVEDLHSRRYLRRD